MEEPLWKTLLDAPATQMVPDVVVYEDPMRREPRVFGHPVSATQFSRIFLRYRALIAIGSIVPGAPGKIIRANGCALIDQGMAR
ncbi:MAG: hypothetical protein EOP84_26915 [Verrucomicrobiaceae bacterium]|nr:MAG: hypothetical protein EOP84_26915 [Verrucomicrobiaceae bacterium]